MVLSSRWVKVAYLFVLATAVALLLQPSAARAQRAPIAPGIGMAQSMSQQSVQEAQMMLMGAMSGTGMGGMGMMGMGGMMMVGMMGMMGMGGMGMMGMGGMG